MEKHQNQQILIVEYDPDWKSPKAVEEYSKLKFKLASETDDISLYLEGKTEFITNILAKTGITIQDLKAIEEVNRSSSKHNLSDNSL